MKAAGSRNGRPSSARRGRVTVAAGAQQPPGRRREQRSGPGAGKPGDSGRQCGRQRQPSGGGQTQSVAIDGQPLGMAQTPWSRHFENARHGLATLGVFRQVADEGCQIVDMYRLHPSGAAWYDVQRHTGQSQKKAAGRSIVPENQPRPNRDADALRQATSQGVVASAFAGQIGRRRGAERRNVRHATHAEASAGLEQRGRRAVVEPVEIARPSLAQNADRVDHHLDASQTRQPAGRRKILPASSAMSPGRRGRCTPRVTV